METRMTRTRATSRRAAAVAAAIFSVIVIMTTTRAAAVRQSSLRPVEAAVRAMMREAFGANIGEAGLDVFDRALARAMPGYVRAPVDAVRTEALSITIIGPVAAFDRDVADAVGRRVPLGGVQWTPGVAITVLPIRVDAPDVTAIVVTRDGARVRPVTSALVAHDLQTPTGHVTLHIGEVVFPASAFDPGGAVVVTAATSSGAPLVRALTPAELARIH
jgi:hypothetical protein